MDCCWAILLNSKSNCAPSAVITRVLGKVRVDAGLSGTMRDILAELLSMYGARRALVASQETNSYRAFVGKVRASEPGAPELRWLESSASDRETYLFESNANAALAVRKMKKLRQQP